MSKAALLLEKVTLSLEKYKKNKTLVSPEDLKGKYKVPFEKLVSQMKDELSDYLKEYSLEGLKLADDIETFAADVNRIYETSDYGRRVGKAIFKEFDLEQVKQIAEELRRRVYEEAWVPYFHRHTCLYATEACLAPDNPQTPRIYNSLVDKFWDEGGGGWISGKTEPAVLIYIHGDAARKEKTA